MEHDPPCPPQLCLMAIPTTHKLFPNPPADVSPQSGTPKLSQGQRGPWSQPAKLLVPFLVLAMQDQGPRCPPEAPLTQAHPPRDGLTLTPCSGKRVSGKV